MQVFFAFLIKKGNLKPNATHPRQVCLDGHRPSFALQNRQTFPRRAIALLQLLALLAAVRKIIRVNTPENYTE